MKRSYALAAILVSIYLICAFFFLGPFGGAGHGWGIGAFLDVSLPASLIAIALDEAFPHYGLAVWFSLVGGALQYALLGYVLQRLISFVAKRVK